MSIYRKLILPLVLLLGVVASTTANAQRFQPFGPLLEEFDHDWQIFAPAEVSSFGGGPEPNYGLFATYDRLHFSTGRARDTVASHEADWGYGNRMDFGYMTDDDHGWLLEVMKISEFSNGPFATTQMTSGELMKQWRHKPLHHGSIVETFLGFRYTVLKSRTNDTILGGAVVVPITTVAIENSIYGPQAGLRWHKQKGRWTISSEGRYYYGYNDQDYKARLTGFNGSREHRWVHAGDIRAEVTYDVTKSFALSIGWEFLYFGNGIARGEVPYGNDQDASFHGLTFGFKFNR